MNALRSIDVVHASEPIVGHSPARDAWQRLKKNRMAMLGLYIALGLVSSCSLGPLIVRALWGYDFETQNLAYGARPPSAQHWFGTDYFGRDLYARFCVS